MKHSIPYILFIATLLIACKEKKSEHKVLNNDTAMKNAADENGWINLFDGKTLEGWHTYNGDSISEQWQVVNGMIQFTPAPERDSTENIVTDKEFTDFILSIDWKISEGGNSGIMWGVKEIEKYNEPYFTGPEIQVLDNERHPDAKINGKLHQAGALYDMVEPAQDVANPAGEWNTCLIQIDHKNNMGMVSLNGTKIVEFPVEGEKWQTMVNKSKFADWEDFGKFKAGKIALQDHGDTVYFKNIKLKKL